MFQCFPETQDAGRDTDEDETKRAAGKQWPRTVDVGKMEWPALTKNV